MPARPRPNSVQYGNCLSNAMHGQNINLGVCVCVCVCPSHFLSTRLQVRPFNLYINPNLLTQIL